MAWSAFQRLLHRAHVELAPFFVVPMTDEEIAAALASPTPPKRTRARRPATRRRLVFRSSRRW